MRDMLRHKIELAGHRGIHGWQIVQNGRRLRLVIHNFVREVVEPDASQINRLPAFAAEQPHVLFPIEQH
jgi:hypothetical protein